ncbi:serine hydrolase domain-containing protein [Streptomyces gamaensis]|uniref:Serine hydrolase domain-containing protein n=1 Tax=Streptomyces gamaensis TaxID=1763542 RepID=A0ABW0Z204_9ACTN
MSDPVVGGTVAKGFEAVHEEFAAVLAEERLGHAAQLAAYVDGQQVVDLWGGPEMTGDALTGVYSSTKGAAYLVVALLVQDGTLDLDERVARYWPEFAAGGKEAVTLRELLTHRVGLVGVEEGLSTEELSDDRLIAERLAGRRPYWRPGTAFGYHALVVGALAGEVVRRVTGRSLQEYYEAHIRAPYGIDLYLGLPEELEHRVRSTLPMDPTPEQKRTLRETEGGPDSLDAIAFNRTRPDAVPLDELPNHRAVRAGGPASVGGTGSARGLAQLYAAAVSGLDGRPALLAPETVAVFSQAHSVGYGMVGREHHAFAVGFEALGDCYRFLGARAFGHSGAAGSQAFADPARGLAFGYTRRRFGYPGGAGPDAERLAGAVHACVVSG